MCVCVFRFGRSALLLSGGASMGLQHSGVVKCLLESNLLPRVISGASAGSIVAAIVGSKTARPHIPHYPTNTHTHTHTCTIAHIYMYMRMDTYCAS